MTRPLYQDASMLPLERLLDAADDGSLALPDFQRTFVWSDEKVKSLLGTVFAEWPAGSLLLVRGDLKQFRTRPLEGAPPLRGPAKYVVLDGQQRLTSLYTALRDTGPTVWTLEVQDIGEQSIVDLSLEERIRAVKRVTWNSRYSTPERQLRAGLLPLSALSTPSSYFQWRDSATRGMDRDESSDLKDALSDLYRERLAGVHRYSLPAVSLESTLDVGAIAGIFEKVNRSGEQLGTFDLMVARVYELDWNLRDEWENARTDKPILDRFLGRDGMPILQAISLLRNRDVRRSAVLKLKEEVPLEWNLAVQSMEATLTSLQLRCGLLSPDWLPYGSLLIGLAALGIAGKEIDSRLSEAWFWNRSFAAGFDVAANTRLVSDFDRLSANRPPVERTSVSRTTLVTASRRSQRALWGAFLCALASRSQTDVFGYSLNASPQPDQDAKVKVGSIFTPSSTQVTANDTPVHLRVLGLYVATPYAERLIRRHGFVDAVAIARSDLGDQAVDSALAAHLLPPGDALRDFAVDPMKLLNYRLQHLTPWLEQWGVVVVNSEEEEST